MATNLRNKLWADTAHIRLEERFKSYKGNYHLQFRNAARSLIQGRISHFMHFARKQIKDQVVLETQAQMTAQALSYDQLPAKIKVRFLYEEEPIEFWITDRTKSREKFDHAKLDSA